jgi:ElaB/YqjD/DUF883 family membrane-anchored ribosome-binding protein
MQMTKPIEEATQDFAADLTALREDITKLTMSVTELVRAQASTTADSMLGVVDNARRKISDTASDAQDRMTAMSSDLESTIERNPLVAIFVAIGAGILIGLLSRSRK